MIGSRKLVAGAVLLSLACMVLRETPHVVTGVGLYSVVQGLALLALLYALYRERARISAFSRREKIGGPVVVLGAIGVLALLLFLVTAISGEVKAGRAYDRIAPDLESEDPVAARRLAGALFRTDRAPLRVRILKRIGRLENGQPEVIAAVLNRLLDDPDRAVRTQAVATLGRILTDAGIVDLVARLPALGATSARLVAKALELRTGRDHGTDAAAWRRYVADELVAAPGERGFRAAADARRRLGDDPAVHAAVIQRIRKGDGASPEALIGLLKDDDPGVRKAAAAALVDRGRPRDVFPLLDRIWLEEDPDVAATLARGALALDPHQARVTLGRVAKTAQSEIARAAAAAALR